MGDGEGVAGSFDRSAGEYDELLRHNRQGAERLVASLPDGDYRDVLDVGCGTGFVSEAMVARFGVPRITGVDPSEGMLEAFRAKLAGLPVEATLIRAGVHDMPVPEEAFDAVVSGMAFHWFPEKPKAIAAMARRVRPGGALGVLASGTGTDREFLEIMRAVRPAVPRIWIDVFAQIQRTGQELAGYVEAAGLELDDAWEEWRVRRTSPEAYLARITAVASHLSEDLDPEEAEAAFARVQRGVADAVGPDGLFSYTFVKIFAVARKPLSTP
jgi:malonyl-CoA O-methyltransferase